MITLLLVKRERKLLTRKLVLQTENLSLISCECDGSILDALYDNEAQVEEIDKMIKEIRLLTYN